MRLFSLMAVLVFLHSAGTGRAQNLSNLPLSRQQAVALDLNTRGLGIIIGSPQTVVTSRHVVQDCRQVTIADDRGRSHHVAILAADDSNDLALLESRTLQGRPLAVRAAPPASFNEPVLHLRPGRRSPQGIETLIGKAHVADLARRGDSRLMTLMGNRRDGVPAFLPGDSGGPVVDKNGLLVGIIAGTVRGDAARASEFVTNIGFAVNATMIELFLHANEVDYAREFDRTDAMKRVSERLYEYAVTVYCDR